VEDRWKNHHGLDQLMADGIVQIAPDSTGKKVDVTELAVGANTIERQRINISSPTDPNGHAEVMNEPPPSPDTTYALLVRAIQEDNAYTQELLAQIASVLSSLSTPAVNANVTYRGLNVIQQNATGLQCTASLTTPNTAIVAGATTITPWQTNALVVTQNSNFPMNNLPPQHLYGGISV
jgi:hypothetical protein